MQRELTRCGTQELETSYNQGAVNLGRTFQSYAMCETVDKKVCSFGKSNQTCPLNLEYYSI